MIGRLKKRRLPTYIRNGDDDTSHQPTYLIYSKSVSFYGTESSETKELEGRKNLTEYSETRLHIRRLRI